MLTKRAAVLLFLGLYWCLPNTRLAAQPSANVGISITSFPAWGQSGVITGKLTGVDPKTVRIYLLMFLADTGWSDPTNCGLPIIVGANGAFQVNLDYIAPYNNPLMFRYWTRINAYVTTTFTGCLQAQEAVPFALDKNALAKTSVPRIPAYRTVSFGGFDWFVKDAPNKVFPGPNNFFGDNVFVDNAG